MTIINCSSNCIHQQEGRCMLDNITINNNVSLSSDCVFFQERTPKQNKNEI